MSAPLLLGIDGGRRAVKAALLDGELRPVAEARRALRARPPGAGLVEQDPSSDPGGGHGRGRRGARPGAGDGRSRGAASTTRASRCSRGTRADGRPLTPVIVWQDKRQEALLGRLDADAAERSGLPLDPYFSAGKLAWLLANDAAVARAARAGHAAVGHRRRVPRRAARRAASRPTSRPPRARSCWRVGGRDWDERLLAAFGVRREWLPSIGAELRRARRAAPRALAARRLPWRPSSSTSRLRWPARARSRRAS